MTDTTFSALGVPYPLVEVLAGQGKTEAFPIQVDTLPDTLAGRDVLGSPTAHREAETAKAHRG